MSRFVIPQGPGLVSLDREPPDGPEARIVKYIPGEIVSIFAMVVAGLISQKMEPETGKSIAVWLIATFFVGTIIYMAVRAPKPVKTAHMIVSPLAFLAWAYPLSSVLLDTWFIGYAAIVMQGIVLLLAVIFAPQQN